MRSKESILNMPRALRPRAQHHDGCCRSAGRRECSRTAPDAHRISIHPTRHTYLGPEARRARITTRSPARSSNPPSVAIANPLTFAAAAMKRRSSSIARGAQAICVAPRGDSRKPSPDSA